MKTVLAIGAHPDDIEIGCGGALALLHQQGCRIIHIIVTSGEEGGINITKETLAQQREQEAQASARMLGAEQVIFLRYPDSLTSYDKAMKLRLLALIREFKPDTIFTHASCDAFPDHQIAHQLTMAAATGAAGPWFPEADGQPHAVTNIYGYEVWYPIQQFQLSVAIESVIDIKLNALACHQSQISGINYVEAVKGLAAYRGIMTMKSGYAEVFEVLRCDLLRA